jgi:hypothetical protein
MAVDVLRPVTRKVAVFRYKMPRSMDSLAMFTDVSEKHAAFLFTSSSTLKG